MCPTTLSINHRAFLMEGTMFAACCLCRGTSAQGAEAPPDSFDMIAYCCLDCAECDAYKATLKNDDSLRVAVAKKWKLKTEQINCLGCKSDDVSFDCSLKKCASKRGIPTCAHCPDFPTCKDEQWFKFPEPNRRIAEAMRIRLGIDK